MHILAAHQSNWYVCIRDRRNFDLKKDQESFATLAAKLTKNLVQDEKMLEIPQNLRISRSYKLLFCFFCLISQFS